MLTIQSIRQQTNQIVVFGNHEPIIQSILDFDYLCGKKEGSVIGIIAGRRGFTKYFFGRREILIPTFPSSSSLSSFVFHPSSNLWFLNITSGRRTLSSTLDILESNFFHLSSNLAGGVLFAENVPELHSLELINFSSSPADSPIRRFADPLIIGPASVGLLVPGLPRHPAGALKLGPIGGITPAQIISSHLTKPGHVAVLSASGGMTNELINIAVGEGHHLSFALSFGGDRFPILSPRDAFLLAESDPMTKTVLYYGELGGEDEYELLQLKKEGKFTKRVVAHIAGTVASLFPESPQFGHAKAKADNKEESALAKREALKTAGFQVSNSFSDFIYLVSKI